MKKYSDCISGGFLILLGTVILFASRNIKRMAGVSVGSDFFPKIAAAMLLVFGVVIIIAFFRGRPDRSPAAAEESDAAEDVTKTDWKAPLVSVVLLAIYVGLLAKVGFIIMTMLYLFVQTIVLAPKEKRNYLLFGILSLVVTLIVYYVFVHVLSVMLPIGLLG